MGNLFQELKRRKVFRVAAVYAVVAWLIIQVAGEILPTFDAPQWVSQSIILILFLGLPLAVVLAWAFDITPDGIQQTKASPLGESTALRKRDYVFGTLVLLLIGVVVVQQLGIYSDLRGETGRDSLADSTIDLAEPVLGFSGRAAIAVLPFRNLSNDPEQEYFTDGITEDLIIGLQSLQSFPIIGSASMFTFKGTSPDVREVAASVGAGYVITGSIQRVDDDVHINVQLNDSQGLLLWGEPFDFKFDDMLDLQSELVRKVMLAIEPELIITEADRTRFVRTEDMEAFDYFLRAATNTFAPFAFTDLNRQEVTLERMEIAREYATKAVELDPNFAGGWRILNHIDATMVINFAPLISDEERQTAIERSIASGLESQRISPFEPSVCSCLSAMLFLNGDLQGAMLLQEEALKQNPSNAAVHAWMARMLQMQTPGNDVLALEEILLAKRLSPQDMGMSMFLYFEAAIYQDLGRFEEAVVTAERALLLAPQNWDAEYVKITSLLASGERQLAQSAISRLRSRTASNFNPRSAYGNVAFPQSVTDAITLTSNASLRGLLYNDGLQLVFEDLGWDSE